MKFQIIMPFSRPHNTEALKTMWAEAVKGASETPILTAVCHTDELASNWESRIIVRLPNDWDAAYYKANAALDALCKPTNEEGLYYGFLCDDDTYEPGIFAAIENAAAGEKPEVIIISSHRWDRNKEPWLDLMAADYNMSRCKVGFEQYFVRADVMAQHRFKNHREADGEMVEELWAKHSKGFKFLPELFVNYNILPL
jgi:hypothetical protein